METGRRVLVVDDSEVDRERIRRLLGPGFSVIEARTAAEGLDVCRMVAVDCVLLDYRLPDHDGIEVLAELIDRDVPVLMLTGQGSEAIAVEAMKRGALDYLIKDRLMRDSLLRSVNNALEKIALRRQVSRQQAELHAYIAELDAKRVELERSNKQLVESQARLRVVLEQLPALVWTTNEGLECTSLAGANLRLIGAVEKLSGGPIAGLFADNETAMRAHTRALSGKPASFEVGVCGRTYNAHVEPLRTGSRVAGVIGVALDVTESRSLEQQLRHSQKMEAMGQLAGGVAHDFNNILTAIVSFSEFVREALHPDEPAYKDIEEVLRASARAGALVRQLLAFSRRQDVEARPVDVARLAATMAPMLRRLMGADVTLDFVPDVGPHIALVDPGGLEQVIVNLVVNARDAMPRGGSVRIEIHDVSFSEETATGRKRRLPPGSYVQVCVSDTGEGIAADALDQIFEPFFTTKAPGKGTGLGLSTCYGIVRQAGGEIVVYSELGQGTTFSVYLPRSSDAVRAQPRRPTQESAGGTETVLIVEDEPQVRSVASRILRRAGYRVLVAADVEQAFKVASEEEPDSISLVLSDFIMPGGTGTDVTERVQQIHPQIAILYMSGYAGGALHSRGLVQDGSVVLHKPFSPPDLEQAVRDALDRRAQLDADDTIE